jgi:hypothetical protein
VPFAATPSPPSSLTRTVEPAPAYADHDAIRASAALNVLSRLLSRP